MAKAQTLDDRAFRDLCGRFATGVTVLTVDDRGTPRGMTANAVSSVSIDPLLMLVCVEGTASAHEAVEKNEPGIFWEAHQADLAYSQIERLLNLDQVPASGFKVACFPLKIKGASGAPARVVAIT